MFSNNLIGEEWKNAKKLGSKLGDEEDVQNRKTKALGAYHRMNKLWLNGKKSQ